MTPLRATSSVTLCGCGRDYLTVPLDGPDTQCPHPIHKRPRPAKPAAPKLGRPPHPKLDEVVDLLRSGWTVIDVAREFRMSVATVAGIRRRTPGVPPARQGRPRARRVRRSRETRREPSGDRRHSRRDHGVSGRTERFPKDAA